MEPKCKNCFYYTTPMCSLKGRVEPGDWLCFSYIPQKLKRLVENRMEEIQKHDK